MNQPRHDGKLNPAQLFPEGPFPPCRDHSSPPSHHLPLTLLPEELCATKVAYALQML